MYEQEKIKPYNDNEEKAQQVETMFDGLASSYDFLNHSMSLGIDKGWRKKAIDSLKNFHPLHILDICTGTGDFAILAAQRLHPEHVTGADLSEGMMNVGREKVKKVGLEGIVSFQREDCLNLSFESNTFDAVCVAYGVRNFQDLDAGLREMHRVLAPKGHLLILELATPPHFPMRQLFWIYAHIVMPIWGTLVCRDKNASTYLPATMAAFPQAEEMENIIRKAGFSSVMWKRFTFGICTMYLADK